MSSRSLAFLFSSLLLASCLSSVILPGQSRETSLNNSNATTFAENLTGGIYYPRCSDPTFATQGGVFQVQFWFNSSGFTEFTISIDTAYEPVVQGYSLQWDLAGSDDHGIILNCTVPETVPIELYNLTVHLSCNGQSLNLTQPRAVDVISSFNDSFTFIQVSDLHVGDWRGISESVYRTLRHRALLQCIKEVNLLHPDFVVITGDIVYGQLYPGEYNKEYPEAYDYLQMFDVPTFLCPGNHDGYNHPGEDGKVYWDKYFEPDYYSFDYGPYHFLSLDSYDFPKPQRLCLSFASLNWGGSIQAPQLQWISDDLNASANAPLTFIILHHNPLLDTSKQSLVHTPYKNREALLSLIHSHGVDMVLAGHDHWDNVTIVNGTIFITTTTPTSSVDQPDSYWGYREIHIQNGTIASYNYKDPKYSTPLYSLRTTPLTASSLWIHNKQIHPVAILAKFILPLGNYSTNLGTITSIRNNDTVSEIYVQATIPASHSSLLRLRST